MARIRNSTPTTLLGAPVTSVQDLLPEADVVILRTDSARVVIRPSGTEPKLKAYLEVVAPIDGPDRDADVAAAVAGARRSATAALAALRTEIAGALGIH